ncbi:MAG: signal recognition particle-docking protein FtsY [Bacteroidia bacterium]|nr:signal recognition particle-docking protein FtsY [Bacteroidia bacterium]
MAIFNLFGKKDNKPKEEPISTREGLESTRKSLLGRIGRAFAGRSQVDTAFLDDLEEILITSDVGVETTFEIIKRLEARVAKDKYLQQSELTLMMEEEVMNLLPDIQAPVAQDFSLSQHTALPYVILVVGVNGVGKTTTIGKLAHHFSLQGKKVVLGAADTFRAAAVDQLGIWKDRTGVEIVSHGMNADPSAVAFDAVKKGVEMEADVVIIDTAGRLHNKVGLMNELAKMKRVVQKFREDAPHEVLLVIDATTGQNAFEQAREFTAATTVNTLAVTKLDGTAKGGVVIGVSHEFGIPVKYIGLGEQAENLKLFNKREFVRSIFEE